MKNLNITPTTLNQDPSHQLRQIHQVTLSQPKTLKITAIIIQKKLDKLPSINQAPLLSFNFESLYQVSSKFVEK